MAQVVRQAVWEAQFASHEVTDKITVRNLEVTVNAGVDAWGRPKEQRALVTVDLTLRSSFQSAATADSLDGSTVHYGILSKEIRSLIASNQSIGHATTSEMSNYIHTRALHTADKAPLASVEIDIFYPKGSMLGHRLYFTSRTLGCLASLASIPMRGNRSNQWWSICGSSA
jgi:dihydroneopterin aldolase